VDTDNPLRIPDPSFGLALTPNRRRLRPSPATTKRWSTAIGTSRRTAISSRNATR